MIEGSAGSPGVRQAGQTPRLRSLRTGALLPGEQPAIRALMDAAFGSGEEAFSDEDWAHSIGGLHFVLDLDDEIVSHASVVERELHIGDRVLRTGYVEAVATAPGLERRGFGTLVMEAAAAHIRETYQLGALGTGRHHFYERMGWLTWAGPAFVQMPGGPRRMPDDEGYILVLRTPTSPPFELTESITCEWRPGDVW